MTNNPLLQQLQNSSAGQNLLGQLQNLQSTQDAIRKPSRRDYQSTIDDDAMSMVISQCWPAIDQLLQQIQRDLGKLPKTELDKENLTVVYFTIGQIIDRFLEVVDRGTELRMASQQQQQNAGVAAGIPSPPNG